VAKVKRGRGGFNDERSKTKDKRTMKKGKR
jgi:hypothetical protein